MKFEETALYFIKQTRGHKISSMASGGKGRLIVFKLIRALGTCPAQISSPLALSFKPSCETTLTPHLEYKTGNKALKCYS